MDINTEMLKALEDMAENMQELLEAIATSDIQAGDDDYRVLARARAAIARARGTK